MQLALDDLVKSPSNKLFPFVKLLLAENLLLETSEASGDASSAQVRSRSRNTRPSLKHLEAP